MFFHVCKCMAPQQVGNPQNCKEVELSMLILSWHMYLHGCLLEVSLGSQAFPFIHAIICGGEHIKNWEGLAI